jgi:hypothetical protein
MLLRSVGTRSDARVVVLRDRSVVHYRTAEHRAPSQVHRGSSSSLYSLLLLTLSEESFNLRESRSLLPLFINRLVELHENTAVARTDVRVVHLVPEVEVHDQVKAAIVQPTELAVVRRGVGDLVVIPLKFVICPHIGLHGVQGDLLSGCRPVGGHVAHVESRGVSCVEVRFVWSQELSPRWYGGAEKNCRDGFRMCSDWWCEKSASSRNGFRRCSECVQVSGVKVLLELL